MCGRYDGEGTAAPHAAALCVLFRSDIKKCRGSQPSFVHLSSNVIFKRAALHVFSKNIWNTV
jgi:hypothetical protein